MEKTKIIFFTPRYFPSIGGVQKHLQQLTKLLKKRYEIAIVTEQHKDGLNTQEVINGIKTYRIPTANITEKSRKWKIWSWLLSNRKIIEKADIVHVHDVAYWIFPLRLLFPNKKFFITYHGYEGSLPPGLKAIFQRKVGEWLSSGTICIGDFMRRWYYAKPTIVSYGAADIKPRILPDTDDGFFLGRLEEDTGIMSYLKAYALLPKPMRVDVYGDGSLKNVAEKFVKDHNLPVEFKGFLPNADRNITKYRFAFVSRYLSILEAMQGKRLVFAHYNNEIKEDYLRCHPQAKNMIIFHTSEELAKKLTEIIENHRLEETYIANAYTWAKEQTWDKLANQYKKLWQGQSLKD